MPDFKFRIVIDIVLIDEATANAAESKSWMLQRANTLGRVAWCVGSSPAPKRPAANRPGWAVA